MLGLKPIKLLPARERVASALRKAIISKSIPEGAELTLENTAQELGVSVTPVREAFQILARDGLLEVKQNKCAIVLGVTEKTIREHYQLRAALEGTACMLCCQNNADLSKIKNCVDTAEEALSHQQAGNYTDYNQSFHFEIWEASGNEKMRNLLSELWNGLSVGVEMSELDYALNSQSEHKKIYAALEARDAMAARAEMEKHILRSMDDALTYYLYDQGGQDSVYLCELYGSGLRQQRAGKDAQKLPYAECFGDGGRPRRL